MSERNNEGGTVLAGFARELPEFIALRGLGIAPFAEAVGINLDDFSSLTKRIELDAFCRLLTGLATVLDYACLGIEFGRYRKGGASGAFGQGFVSAPTVKDMILFYTKYVGTVVDHRFFEATFERHSITISWAYSPLVTNTSQFVDAAIASFLKVIDSATDGRQIYRTFNLTRSRSEMPAALLKTFPGQISFDNNANSVVLANDTLSLANPHANHVLYELMTMECEKQLIAAQQSKPLVTLLKEEIVEGFAIGSLPISAAARQVGMSVRTLQRRLADQNLTYDGLIEQVRFELIERKLKHSNEPLAQIAFAVGYSEPSSFARAVSRKYGCSPSELRRRVKR